MSKTEQDGKGSGIALESAHYGFFGDSDIGYGVVGESTSFVGVAGVSSSGTGVYSQSNGQGKRSGGGHGALPQPLAPAIGVHGIAKTPGIQAAIGVLGESDNGTGVSARSKSGVAIQGTTDDDIALVAISTNSYGVSGTGGDIGIYAHNSSANGNDAYLATKELAGDFYGNVYIHGNATVTGDIVLTNTASA